MVLSGAVQPVGPFFVSSVGVLRLFDFDPNQLVWLVKEMVG
jgi:hypothetical protein